MSDRPCAHCGKPLIQHQRAIGYREPDAMYARRLYCSAQCDQAAQQKKAYARQMAERQNADRGNCLYCGEKLEGRQRRFCCTKHRDTYWSSCFPKTAEAK